MNDENDFPRPVPQFPIPGAPMPPTPPVPPQSSSPSDGADSAEVGAGAMQATAALGNERNPNDQMWWPADDDHVNTRRKSNPKTWILAGAGTVAIAAASIVGINAASSHSTSIGGATPQAGQFGGPGGAGGGPGQSGTIAAVDGTTLTLTKSAGSTTKVTTSTATAVTLTTTGTATDLAVGDHVVVTGTAANGTITAQRIVDSGAVASAFGGGPGLGGFGGGQGAPANGAQPANATGAPGNGQSGVAGAAGQPPQGAPTGQGAPGGFVVGTIASINGTSMTITANDATTTNATITATTQASIQRTGSLADIAVGAQVTINGTTGSTGEIAATAIRVAATS